MQLSPRKWESTFACGVSGTDPHSWNSGVHQ